MTSKYKIGQTLYRFRYYTSKPELLSFVVGCIKLTKSGYKYGPEKPAYSYYGEEMCFSSIEEAVNDACSVIKSFLK